MTEQTSRELYNAVSDGDMDKAERLARSAVPDKETLNLSIDSIDLGADWTEMLIKAGGEPTSDMLYKAVLKGYKATAEILIAGGVVPDDKTLELSIDCRNLKADWTEMLIAAGAKPTSAMLFKAAVNDYLGTAEVLIAGGALPDQKTMDYAARWRAPEWTETLSKAIEDDKEKRLAEAYNTAAAAQQAKEVLDTVRQMRGQIAKNAARPGPGT